MGTKQNPGVFDAYEKAAPDEPYFVLLARDPAGPGLVEAWAELRRCLIDIGAKPHADMAMVVEARNCADQMQAWRQNADRDTRRHTTSIKPPKPGPIGKHLIALAGAIGEAPDEALKVFAEILGNKISHDYFRRELSDENLGAALRQVAEAIAGSANLQTL